MSARALIVAIRLRSDSSGLPKLSFSASSAISTRLSGTMITPDLGMG